MLEGLKNGRKNWASPIKDILDMYSFSYIWNNQKIGNLIKIALLTTFCKNMVFKCYLFTLTYYVQIFETSTMLRVIFRSTIC